MTTKRAYKLQEFVAHTSNVNCLNIGGRTSRVLVTGGEDHKVNLWAIGKPNAILSLSGHTSAVESVSFDSSEVLVAAGAASGSIKLWDLEEAKIVRTLTGHRSNCISVDFHPFGEFFASGSLDTNLKIWDIRKKGCIHTYKGHTRGVNAIKFTPDGRWVVSGGEDNIVKLWDLTAGKLLHDFKSHEGQIQCIDFHPHEFLLATGSADKTVKFWDLETFELIGSTGPETSGVRSITFNPDGRTLLCGFHESLKVFSWEPVICHDTVEVGWSKLLDMNIHEGKLLGCSYNQSCVGVWVVDMLRVEPYTVASTARPNSRSESRSPLGSNLSFQTGNNLKDSVGRLSVSQNSEIVSKEAKPIASVGIVPATPQRTVVSTGSRTVTVNSSATAGGINLKRSLSKNNGASGPQIINKSDVVPVIVPKISSTLTINKSDVENVTVPRTNCPQMINKSEVVPVIVPRTTEREELATESRKEMIAERLVACNIQSKINDSRRSSSSRDGLERFNSPIQSGFMGNANSDNITGRDSLNPSSGVNQLPTNSERNMFVGRTMETAKLRAISSLEPCTGYQNETYDIRINKPRDSNLLAVSRGGRTKSLVQSWERMERSPRYESPTPTDSFDSVATTNIPFTMRGRSSSMRNETVSASDEDAIADLLEHHGQFIETAQSRLTKLRLVQRLWERKDIKGMVGALEKLSDHAVSADVFSVLVDRSDIITLDLCTCLLPPLTSLLESKMDRCLGISLEMLQKLVKIFGSVIYSTISAGPSVGVDLQAEQRLERCNLCYIELEKVKQNLTSLTRCTFHYHHCCFIVSISLLKATSYY
ncbi:Katanin p80 WD40 repeat-containing subunit B1 like [Apostasia shenzhenica]|uniref:Katanin p80 WD40 repeat-containing subunit B1 homolog n=1 Tax=Apostasia shenzhenica TaxID=1088818 RepID=A0A2I0BBT5_9ASPA|nr:Katanin p80 WD40 repeat-containing subunit B1 like [Apostasia shenzhenica]